MYVKTPKKITFGWAVTLLVIGIVMGTVFTFVVSYWNANVKREECDIVTARLDGYEKNMSRHGIREIFIYCDNGERYTIDGIAASSTLVDRLSHLDEGTQLSLILHPNSGSVLELTAGGSTLMKFGETVKKLGGEQKGFFLLGIFMYVCAAVGLFYVVKLRRKKIIPRRRK